MFINRKSSHGSLSRFSRILFASLGSLVLNITVRSQEPIHSGVSCAGLHVEQDTVGLSFGGVAPKPDVQWFIIPPAGVLQADQPAVSGVVSHANITRYWSTTGPSANYRVVLPPGQFSTSLVSASIAGVSGTTSPASLYRWQDFITAVDNTFAKFLTCNTAQLPSCVNAGTLTANYQSPATTLPPSVLANPLGTWSVALGGPTGNGINEIILTNQPALAGSVGLCSMNVNAAGVIQEADVILYAPTLFTLAQTGGGGATAALTAIPEHWTALTHEIGHYWGLDHTNLHPGSAPTLPGTLSAPTNFSLPASGSAAVFPASSTIYPGGSVWVPIPGMCGIITHLGGLFDYTLVALHPDDQTSLSKIYPVSLPNTVGGVTKVPLINQFGRIIGRQTSVATGIFGRNVWADGDLRTIGIPGNLGYPVNGTISGCSRLSTTEPSAFFLANSVYSRPFGHAVLGTFNATGLLPGIDMFANPFTSNPNQLSVVGSSLSGGLQTTGDYSIDGLTPGYAYDIVFETGSLLGATAPNLAEWFGAPGIFANPPVAAGLSPMRMKSATGQLFGVAASSTNVNPGTVIAIDPLDHNEANFNIFGLTNVFETYSRPLVSITPRAGRAAPGVTAMTITALPQLGPLTAGVTAINQASAVLFINGVNQSALLTNPATTVAVNPTSGLVTWTIPIGLVTAGISSTTPINVSFLVSEVDAIGAGYGPYLTFGRNDVVL